MAGVYDSGTSSSFAELLQAVEAFLGGQGYIVGDGPSGSRIIRKGSLVTRWRVTANALQCFGATGAADGATSGECPYAVVIGSPALAPMLFPVSYEIFYNDTPEEFYLVVSYNGDKYQHINFGLSDIEGVGGTGMWCTGSYSSNASLNFDQSSRMFIGVYSSGGGGYVQATCIMGFAGGFFLGDSGSCVADFVHCGLDFTPTWLSAMNTSTGLHDQGDNAFLLSVIPSTFNQGNVLLPIQKSMRRPSGLLTVVASMRHARWTRIDNIAPGTIITFGSDRWKVFPLYAKNTAARNGVPWGTGAEHSGTLGVAIRYFGD